MSTTTHLQLRDQVILDAGIKNDPNFPPLRVTRIINLAQRYVQTQLNGLGFKKWESSIATGTLTAGYHGATAIKSFLVSVMTDMLESPNSILLIETTDSTTKGIARPIDPNVFEEQISNTYLAPTLAKGVFTRLSGSILLAPSTITGGTVYYYKNVTDLSADADVSEIPLEFIEFVIKKAVNDINEAQGKLQNAGKVTQELEGRLQEVYQKFHSKQQEQNRIKQDNAAKLQ